MIPSRDNDFVHEFPPVFGAIPPPEFSVEEVNAIPKCPPPATVAVMHEGDGWRGYLDSGGLGSGFSTSASTAAQSHRLIVPAVRYPVLWLSR